MKAVIFLNGEPYRGEADTAGAWVIAADGAYRDCLIRGIRPDETVGDFDSLGFVPEGAESVPVRKNFTDGQLAAEIALARGADEVVFYGGGGGREDHFYGNLQVLYFLMKRGVRAEMVTNYTRIFLTDRGFDLTLAAGTTLSVAPFFEQVHIHDSDGLEYPANDLIIHAGETRGISNRAAESRVRMTVSGGIAVVFVVAAEFAK